MRKRFPKWQQLPKGLGHAFDPSGERIAFSREGDKLVIQCVNGRQVVIMEGQTFYTLVWATANEIVTIGSPVSQGSHRQLCVVRLHSKCYHSLFRVPNGWSLARRTLGQVSYLGAIERQYGLYIINTENLSVSPMNEYAFIWDLVDVLPSGGHAWGPKGDDLAFIGLPKLSQFRPSIAMEQVDCWQLQTDVDQMFHDNPYRLYIANPDTGIIEISGSEGALDPLWAPGLPVIVFRKTRPESLYIYNLIENKITGVIDNLFLMPVMHPEGFLYYRCASITDLIRGLKNLKEILNWCFLDLKDYQEM
jgi:hypothetical protein